MVGHILPYTHTNMGKLLTSRIFIASNFVPSSKFREEVDLGLFQPLVEKHVLTSRYYKSKEIKRKSKRQPKDLTRGTHENFPFSLVQNIVKTALISGYKYPQVRGLNVVVDVPIAAVWMYEDDVTMTVRGRPGMWLNSAHPFPPLFDEYLEWKVFI